MENTFYKKYEFWPLAYSKTAISFVLLLILLLYAFFPFYVMPIPILFFGFLIIAFFFLGINQYSLKWMNISAGSFKQKLFWHSFLFRMIFVGLMYLLTLWLDPQSFPFEIGAMDSWKYHLAGIDIAKEISDGHVGENLSGWYGSKSDYGFPLYVGIVYYLFGPYTLAVRVLNALWGSLTVVYIYKIASALYHESNGRFAGIIAMLMPPFLWFGAKALKETLMIFIIVLIVFYSIKIVQKKKLGILSFISLLLLILSLFFFRAFLPVHITICLVLYFLLNSSGTKSYKFRLLLSAPIIAFIIYGFTTISGVDEMVQQTIAGGSTQFELETTAAAGNRGISYDRSLIFPLMFAGAVITPFPSFLDFDQTQLEIYSHYFNDVIRNILYYFSIIGVYLSLKYKFKETSIITLFALGYIFILAVSGVAYQDRFQLPSLPFMVIFMSAGFMHHKSFKIKWTTYLFFIVIAIFLWNTFKLSNRGLI